MATKSQTSIELVRKVQALEDRSDLWAQESDLFKREWNLAAWLGLTACARALELEVPATSRGGSLHQTAVTNISTTAYQLYRAARRYGSSRVASRERLRWTISDSLASQTLADAFSYAMFCVDFPAWHKDLNELISVDDEKVVFSASNVLRTQRFMAYEKGIRPMEAPERRATSPELPVEHAMKLELLQITKSLSAVSKYSFRHDPLSKLYRLLYVQYDERLRENFRRSPAIDLGGYTLLQFRKFYAALLSIAGAKEHVCYLWRTSGHEWPCDELLAIHSKPEWLRKISVLTSMPDQVSGAILDHMTLAHAEVPNRNLTMYPFVPLDNTGTLLAVVPGFVLASNPEENILRISSFKDKAYADVASTTKEDDALLDLRNALPHLRVLGPFKLKKGMPDLDLVIEDEETESLLIAELKWLQNPMTLLAREERSQELAKGVRQMMFIESFLRANPEFLARSGKVSRSLAEYRSVTYAVLCRDYITDVTGAVPVFPYAALRRKLALEKASLPTALAYLKSDAWLPRPEVDYRLERTFRSCNGVTVGSEMFIPLYPDSLEIMEPSASQEGC